MVHEVEQFSSSIRDREICLQVVVEMPEVVIGVQEIVFTVIPESVFNPIVFPGLLIKQKAAPVL